MIKLRQPTLVLNSFDPFLGGFSMWATWKMPKQTRPYDIVHWILYARKQAPELMLHHVVLNFHGVSGEMHIGETAGGSKITLDFNNVGAFTELRAKDIGIIWLKSCAVAQGYKGKWFCREMARASGCDVVAADVDQTVLIPFMGKIFYPYGKIDDFEGSVFRWSATGTEERFNPNGGSY